MIPVRSVVILFLLLAGIGCGPSYPKNELAESLIRLCKEEYGVDVSVQIVGKTLGVYIPLEKLFDSTLRLSPDVGDQLDGVVLATSRVVLSTNDPPDFYVIVAQDKRIPGVELKLTRYVQDIRRLNYQDLSRGEFTKRMLFEFGIDLGIFQEGGKGFHLEEVKLEQFLARQMAHRIRTRLDAEGLLTGTLELKSIKGEFIPSLSQGRFVMTLSMQRQGIHLWGALEEKTERKILHSVIAEILEVLRGYRFSAFDSVEISAPFLTHPLILGRDVLELYRRKKIGLSELLLPNHLHLSPHDAELLLKQ